jgi:hypothetical protein
MAVTGLLQQILSLKSETVKRSGVWILVSRNDIGLIMKTVTLM